MKREWLIIPDYEHLEESAAIATEYGAAFEYNDFYLPSVYQDAAEVDRRMEAYCALNRDRSRDTLHGAFMDLSPSSGDSVIQKRTAEVFRQSLEIAKRLGVRGVVFHTGLVPGVESEGYLNSWLTRTSRLFRELLEDFPEQTIFLENTTERTPAMLVRMAEELREYPNFKLCLDYAHAAISGSPAAEWVQAMAPYVGHMHVNDNDGLVDLHQVPGTGVLNYKQMEKELDQAGITCPILLELNGNERARAALTYMQTV